MNVATQTKFECKKRASRMTTGDKAFNVFAISLISLLTLIVLVPMMNVVRLPSRPPRRSAMAAYGSGRWTPPLKTTRPSSITPTYGWATATPSFTLWWVP